MLTLLKGYVPKRLHLAFPSTEEELVYIRAMDLNVARRAILEPRRRLIVEARGVGNADRSGIAVALDTELADLVALEQTGIVGAVGGMADRAALNLGRRVLEDEGALFICVALEAGLVSARRHSSLF